MICDGIFILSAKHGLIGLNDVVDTYDETLTNKPVVERRIWAERIILELRERTDPEKDEFLILAGKRYYEL